MSAPIPLMIGTALSQNPEILASEGNPASYVQVDDRNNIHLSWLGRSPSLALALIATTPSLKSSGSRSLLLLSRTRRRLILLLLATSTRISDAPCTFYFSFNGQGCPDHLSPLLSCMLEDDVPETPGGYSSLPGPPLH